MNPERQRRSHLSKNPDWQTPSLKEGREWNKRSKSFERHLKALRLSPDDLRKKILDVGADTADFAREAATYGYKDIYSIEIIEPKNRYLLDDSTDFGAGKYSIADTKQLPFQDGTFDITISYCAMPNVLTLVDRSRDGFRGLTEKTLRELLRVTKDGGEVRLGRVAFDIAEPIYGFRRGEEINKVLEKLRGEGLDASIEETDDIYNDTGTMALMVRLKKPSKK